VQTVVTYSTTMTLSNIINSLMAPTIYMYKIIIHSASTYIM